MQEGVVKMIATRTLGRIQRHIDRDQMVGPDYATLRGDLQELLDEYKRLARTERKQSVGRKGGYDLAEALTAQEGDD